MKKIKKPKGVLYGGATEAGKPSFKCPQCGSPMEIRITGPRAGIGACRKCNFRFLS